MTRTKTKTEDAPTELPEPTASVSQAVSAGAPTMDVSSLLGTAVADLLNRPSMSPPNEIDIQDQEVGLTAWHNGKKITATWTNSSTRNAYVAIEGLGWKRLSDANDSSHLSMVMMAAHAEQTGATVNVQIGNDQEVHQIYVW